jgi:sugar lactone lactonase YvrE
MKRATHILAQDIYFGEGPRWHGGRLWFSDFFAHAVKSISLEGDLRTEFEIDDQPSGLGWIPDGTMLIVSMDKRQILRRALDGTISLHAELTNVRFRSNDMVVGPTGMAFVGDFGFDLEAEIEARGVASVLTDHPTAQIACVSPSGAVRVVADGMHFPNGSVITASGRTLIVGETLAGVLSAFEIGDNGSLTHRRVWAKTWPRLADGITLNADGAIWFANPTAPECVLIAEGGAVLDIIDTEQPCFACMLGGDDGTSLFMFTAPTSVAPDLSEAPKGKLLIATVDVPHAGYP